ncbi:MAG TPA: hypothetical protein EYG68_00305 [Leucothrix mucor]|nr:hypothetical protein [Leucothrix mucor]
MFFKPSDHPGSFERHLYRRVDNPLFANQTELTDETLEEAQRQDHEVIVQFMQVFQETLEKTVALKGTEESDVVLELKDRLDKLYEQASAIGDDQTKIREAIVKLLQLIMASVRKGAGDDAHAHQELDQEDEARQAHFALLETSIVADILNPTSPIAEDELVPVLLGAEKDDLALVVQIFDEEQIKIVIKESAELVLKLEKQGVDTQKASENAVFIQGYLEYLRLEKH